MSLKPNLALHRSVVDAALNTYKGGTVPLHSLVSERVDIDSIDVGGDAIFKRHAQLISAAKSEAFVQTFAWDPHSTGGREIVSAVEKLIDTHKRELEKNPDAPRIRVRLLVNEGGALVKRVFALTSANLGGVARRFPSDVQSFLGIADEQRFHHLMDHVDVQVRVHQHTLSNALHAKTVVVDGEEAAITGANVQQRNHGANAAYDYGISLHGNVAQGLRDDFAANWNRSQNPDAVTEDISSSKASMNTHPIRSRLFDWGNARVILLTKKPRKNFFSTSTKNPQDAAFLAATKNASTTINIMTPNINQPKLLRAVAEAAKRGVNVNLLVSKSFNDRRESLPLAGGTNDYAIKKLQKLSRNSENLHIKYYTTEDGVVPYGNAAGNGASHAKYFSADDVTIVGSANQDNASWHLAGETNLAFIDAEITDRIRKNIFDGPWNNGTPVT